MTCPCKDICDIEQGLGGGKEEKRVRFEESAPDDASVSTTSAGHERFNRIWIIVSFIVVLGCATSSAFLAIGVTSAVHEQEDQFERSAADLVSKIESAWEDYVHAASVIHGRCRSRDFSRQDFRNLYEYLISDGLEFQAAQFDPNISHAERDYYEQEARDFYREYYPHIDYKGFKGFNTEDSPSLEPRWNASFYFPIHYMEPVIGNEVCLTTRRQ